VITGASSGIGEASAVALAALGHPVVLGARRVELCEQTAASIRANGGDATALPLDVGDRASRIAFADAAVAAVGQVEIVVSNAGDVLPSSTLDTDADAFAGQIEVNLLGAHHLISLLAPAMVARRRGDIVFITSDVVRVPRPSMASYVTSKWGLEGLARALQLELEGTGVRASIVRPGPTITGMGSAWTSDVVDPLLTEWSRHGLLRHDGYLSPDGVAGAIIAVVSAPRGTHLTLVEVEPEAPVQEDS
jgi:NAD(P)-dependent dehydrogenase (short-subunit alcohol dehydrogenase family)